MLLRTYRYSRILALFLVTVDSLLLCASASLASYLQSGRADWSELHPLVTPHAFALFVVIATWIVVGWPSGIFLSHRQEPLLYQMYLVLRTAPISLATSFIVVSFTTGVQPDTRYAFTFLGTTLLLLGGFRFSLCVTLWLVRQRGFNPRYVVVAGANPRSAYLVQTLQRQASYGFFVRGVLEDDPDRMAHLAQFNLTHLGSFSALRDILASSVVDEVHVCLPVRSCYETIQEMANQCLSLGVSLRIMADLFPLQLATSRLHHLQGIPMLSVTVGPERPGWHAIKRLADIVGAVCLLVVLWPVFLVVIVLLKLTSEGPVFFTQERAGMNYRRFKMIKFRSMVANAEDRKVELAHLNEADGPIFKIRKDPRVTRLGQFLRRSSIDELPQLFNVLRGDMSLVGPRPHPTSEVAEYDWRHRRRLSVKPGMTGLAQISGRSDLSWDDTVALDLTYIDTWSLWLDATILLKTVRAVILAYGAA